MRTKSFFWAFPAAMSIGLLTSHLVMAQPSVKTATQSPLQSPVPMLLQEDNNYTIQHTSAYGNWSIVSGKPYASLLWQQPNSSLKFYITPSKNMITLDVIAKKNESRDYKLPFITWNIKNVSVTLNKISDYKGWVQFSTSVYTQNIDKLVSALQDETPMILNLSVLHSIPVSTDGLHSAMNDFTRLIRQNNLIAPKPLAINVIEDDTFVPLDGMSPEIFPLYQETNYYVKQCISMASTAAGSKTRYNICMKRNELLKQMKAKGWCWGSGDVDQHDKDKNWRKCVMSPKGDIEKIKEHTKQDFDKAKSITGDN